MPAGRGNSRRGVVPNSLLRGRRDGPPVGETLRMRATFGQLRRVRQILERHPRSADAALAALVLTLTVQPLLDARSAPPWSLPLVLAECLPLLCRRSRPFTVFLVIGILAAVHGATPVPEPVLPWAAVLAVYGVAADASRRLALTAAALMTVVIPVALLLDGRPTGLEAFTATAVTFAAAWLVGDATRHRRERAALLEVQAVAAERARMAREMHDVLGHHLSLMVVQAEAGPPLLDRSPQAAVRAFDSISATGRQALTELRQVLGTLHGAQPAPREPVHGLAGLPALLDGVRRAGIDVEQVVTGAATALPPAGDRAVFRVVQEALTNVVKHAGSRAATVTLHYEPDVLRVSIRDAGQGGRAPADGGSGLVGMRERVCSVGGQFAAGPAPGGGWLVSAVIPVGGVGA